MKIEKPHMNSPSSMNLDYYRKWYNKGIRYKEKIVDITIFLSRILGFYFLGIGIAFFLNSKHINKMYQIIMSNNVILFFSGIVALLFGSLIVGLHNVWIMDWSVIITIIGWMSVAKGIGLLIWPDFTQYFSFIQKNSFFKSIGLVLSLVGLFFLYQGWNL